MEEKFKLGKKWFWIGIVFGLNPIFGLIYGIALVCEKKFRKEGLIIIGWTIVWYLVFGFVLSPALVRKGYLPSSDCLLNCYIQSNLQKQLPAMPNIGEPLSPYLQ